MKIQTNLNEIFLTVFIYVITLICGWQLISFLYIYSTLNQDAVGWRLIRIYNYQPYITVIGIFIISLILLLTRVGKNTTTNLLHSFKNILTIFTIYLVLLLINIFLYSFDLHINILELTAFFLDLWILTKLGSALFNQKFEGWHHPTTNGGIFISSLLIGIALLDLFGIVDFQNNWIKYSILMLLSFDLIILFARFQYLSKHSHQTNRLARNLMSNQILLFGLRIIVGVFMPLIFIIYSTIINENSLQGISALILLGTILERYLFCTTRGTLKGSEYK
jgi:hypothetical protein